MVTRAKISAVRANSFVVVEKFIVFFLVIRNSANKRRIVGAALMRGRRLLTLLSQMRRLFEGGAYLYALTDTPARTLQIYSPVSSPLLYNDEHAQSNTVLFIIYFSILSQFISQFSITKTVNRVERAR